MEIVTIETGSLGDRSYLVVDGDAAAVIDPQRDIDRVVRHLDDRAVRLAYVFETHLHNDYVTGGYQLATTTGARYVLPAADEVEFERVGANDGDEFPLGDHVVVRAVHTPGHTPHHLAYVVVDDGDEAAVFTGGSMLFGAVGRTDLIDESCTEELTRAQYRSVRRLAQLLPDDASVLPTHGFGSFCSSSAASDVDDSTIGHERRTNVALTTDDEDEFVERLLSGLSAYPRYYAHMAPRNRRGPGPIDLSPPAPVDAAEVRRRIHAGEWVVDLRDRTAFARKHLAGTINIEIGDSFVTYLGWTIRWGTPVTLVADTVDEIERAQRQMVRIGIDRPAGASGGGLDRWADVGDLRSFRSATFEQLADEHAGGPTVLDVRRGDEWADDHIDGALNIPLHELEERIGEVPGERPVWVHCASGYRASIAASLLDRAGREVVVIHDDFQNAPGDLLAAGATRSPRPGS